MRILINGLETPVAIIPGEVETLVVDNRRLFARIVQSLCSNDQDQISEAFTIWGDEGNELKPQKALLPIMNPFELPFQEKYVIDGMYSLLETEMLANEQRRQTIERHSQALFSELNQIGLSLESQYGFNLQWDMRRFLKAYAFGVEYDKSDPLLDNLIKLLSTLADLSIFRTLVFVNLKTFLTENDIQVFYDQVFFFKNQVLLLETSSPQQSIGNERIYHIDQDFIENQFSASQDFRSSAERIVL